MFSTALLSPRWLVQDTQPLSKQEAVLGSTASSYQCTTSNSPILNISNAHLPHPSCMQALHLHSGWSGGCCTTVRSTASASAPSWDAWGKQHPHCCSSGERNILIATVSCCSAWHSWHSSILAVPHGTADASVPLPTDHTTWCGCGRLQWL